MMDQNDSSKSSTFFPAHFLEVSFSFIFMSLLLRAFELFSVSQKYDLPYNFFILLVETLVIDVFYSSSIVFILSPLMLIFSLMNKKLGLFIQVLLLSIFLVVNFCLARYFSITFLPLGSDLWGYSLADIRQTISASDSGLGLPDLLVITLIGLSPFLVFRLFEPSKLRVTYPKFFIFCGLAPMAFYFMNPPLERYDSPSNPEYLILANKTVHFSTKTYEYFYTEDRHAENWAMAEYPLLKSNKTEDTLGKYFNLGEEKPNVVIVIVEGLGSTVMAQGENGGFTPFLDQLSKEGLYWRNAVSTSGRTFGALPAILASLPHGKNGILEMDQMIPEHLSLIKILRGNGYTSRFFHGSNADFDKMRNFLKIQNTDLVFDQFKFAESDEMNASIEGFSWGFSDKALFNRSFDHINSETRSPYLDTYLTITTHEPFEPPQKEKYLNLFHKRLEDLNIPEAQKEKFRKFELIFSTFLYTDDALREFFEKYKQTPQYGNTIFVITGDHRMTPVAHTGMLDRFHVPLIVYSPMLKENKQFRGLVSHLDITPGLLSLLDAKYKLNVPEKVHWMGGALDTSERFQARKSVALMLSKTEMKTYIHEKHVIIDNDVFEIKDGLKLNKVYDDKIIDLMTRKLSEYKKISSYVCEKDKIYPASAESRKPAVSKIPTYEYARSLAREKKFEEARAVCLEMLKDRPNDHDVRTLMGRTYSWSKEHDKAREVFNEVIKRSPNYSDAYAALAQIELWTNNPEQAYDLASTADRISPNNNEFQLVLASSLRNLGRRDEALEMVDQILQRKPDYQDAIDFRKTVLPVSK